MVNSHGSGADFIGNGYVLSEYLNSASFSGSRDTAETTTFKKKSKTYIPGLKDTNMNAEGIFDGDPNAADEVLWAALDLGTNSLFTYMPMGHEVVGRMAYTMDAIETSYEINTEVGDVAQITAEFNAGERGSFNRGKVLSPMGVKAAPGNSVSIDNGAQSLSGGGIVVHTTTAANLVVKLQDSADNTTFADLPGTVSVAAGRASVRLVYTGTIRRYTRALWTGTGTFMAIVERN